MQILDDIRLRRDLNIVSDKTGVVSHLQQLILVRVIIQIPIRGHRVWSKRLEDVPNNVESLGHVMPYPCGPMLRRIVIS